MNKRKSQTIFNLIQDACSDKDIPFTKAGYRRAKKAYNTLKRTRRHLVV